MDVFLFVVNEEVRSSGCLRRGWFFLATAIFGRCIIPFFTVETHTHLNILRGRPGAATESDEEKSAVSTPAVPSLAVQAEQEEHWADIECDIRLANETSHEVRF